MDRLFLPFIEKVKLIITHFRPHLDELGAWWLALRFGENIFPGIKSAVLKLWNAGNKTPDGRAPRQWKEQDGALLMGVGGALTTENPDGAEFDEHGLFTEKTTLILMAEALGLTTEPALRSLLKYVQANDRKGNATPWDLASILKALNAHTLNTVQVATFVFERLDANYNRELRNDPNWKSSVHADLFDGHLADWLWDSFSGKAKDTVERPATAGGVIEFLRIGGREDISEILKLVLRDHNKGAAGPFDIITMFSEMVDNGGDAGAQRDFVYIIMNAKFAQQRRFVEAVNEVRTNAIITWVGDQGAIEKLRKPRTVENPDTLKAIADLQALHPEGDKDIKRTIEELRASMVKPAVVAPNATILVAAGIRPFQIISVVSDNEEILKAMRVLYPNSQFHIRRQTSKHSVINGPRGVIMDSVCAETHIAENMRRFGSNAPRIPLDNLRKAGNIPEDPAWSYHQEGGQMLNGSLTSPGAQPTVQTLEGLWKGIARALLHCARYEDRIRIHGAPPPSRSGKPSGKPAGKPSHKHDGRRPETQTKGSKTPTNEGFTNNPHPATVPDAPAPVPTEPVIPEPVADVSPASVMETPVPESVIPAPVPESEPTPTAVDGDRPTRKARTKPRRKAVRPKSKSDKA